MTVDRCVRQNGRLLVLLVVMLCVSLPGCDRPAANKPAQTAPPPNSTIALDTPTAATRTLFDLLREHLDAVVEHDKPRAATLRDQVAWHVAERTSIITRVTSVSGVTVSNIQAVSNRVENWAAILNFYIDGIELEGLDVTENADGDRALVTVPAHHRDHGDRTLIQLACLKIDDEWRVADLDLAPLPVTATLPASAPDSAEAYTP